MQSNRYNNIDALKGLGITFVLLTHTNAALLGESVWTAFYMSLFFWASGYLYHSNTEGYIRKKIKILLFPYFIAAVGYMLLDFHRYGFLLTL